jgi:hypothetical protein
MIVIKKRLEQVREKVEKLKQIAQATYLGYKYTIIYVEVPLKSSYVEASSNLKEFTD